MSVIPFVQLDHCSYVVPDLEAAIQFFTTYLGFELISTEGPVIGEGDRLTRVYAVPERAIGRSAHVRQGDHKLEFVEWKTHGESLNPLRESSVPGCHIALRVTDLEAAMAVLQDIPRIRFLDPDWEQGFVICFTPFGFQLQLMRSAYAS